MDPVAADPPASGERGGARRGASNRQLALQNARRKQRTIVGIWGRDYSPGKPGTARAPGIPRPGADGRTPGEAVFVLEVMLHPLGKHPLFSATGNSKHFHGMRLGF